MTDKIKVGLHVDSNLSKEAKEAQRLSASLKEASKNAKAVKVDSGIAQRNASQTKTFAAAQAAAASTTENINYGISRGIAGTTGAASRDFAKQAQGLGGLVHLYATYAANIFAVSAAFKALSDAADTTNMIRGLNQLGAQSGMALGNLSKELVKATDGAISLREAMTATVKASSSGMDSDSILRMGKVAKQASQALGIDMVDAVSRISRGITKLEPELLDELGIFVRVDTVVKDYAKSVGKSADAITDFEKRMAFANATISQGEKKFGAIDMDTNPYTKLLATMKDVMQTGLELTNTVLTPILRLLSENPTALAVAMTAIGGILLKQAIPAIGQFKEGLRDSAEVATKVANARFLEVKKITDKETQYIKAALDIRAQAAYDNFEATSERLKSSILKNGAALKSSKFGLSIASKDIGKIDEDDLAKLDKLGQKNTKISEIYRQQAADIREYRKEAKAYSEAAAEVEAKQAARFNTGTLGQLRKINDREQTQAYSREIQSQAAYIASTQGIATAWKAVNEQISLARSGKATRTFNIQEYDEASKRFVDRTVTQVIPQMSAIRAGMVRAAAGVGILTGALTTAMNAFGWVAQLLAISTAALALFDSWASKASKQVSSFSESVKSLNDTGDSLVRTIDAINAKDPSQIFSIDSIKAQSAALNELSLAVNKLGKDYTKAEVAIGSNFYDTAKNALYGLFGKDIESDFTKQLSTTIVQALVALDEAPLEAEFKKKLSNALSITDIGDTKELQKAISKIKPNTAEFATLARLLKESNIYVGNIAVKAAAFTDSTTKVNEAYRGFSEQFKVKDPLTLFAQESTSSLTKLAEVLRGDATSSIGALNELFKDTANLKLFGSASSDVIGFREEVIELNRALGEQKAAAESAKSEIQKLTAERNKSNEYYQARLTLDPDNVDRESASSIAAAREVLNKFDSRIEVQKSILAKTVAATQTTTTRIAQVNAQVYSVIPSALKNQVALIQDGIVAAIAKGSTQFIQSLYGKAAELTGDATMVRRETELKVQELNAQSALLKSNRALVIAMERSAAATEELTARLALDKQEELMSRNPNAGVLGRRDLNTARSDYEKAKTKVKALDLAGSNPSADVSGLTGTETYFKDVTDLAMKVAGFNAQINSFTQQIKSALLEGSFKELDVISQQSTKELSITRGLLDLETQRITQQKERGSITQSTFLIERETLQQYAENNKYQQDVVNMAIEQQKMAVISNALRKEGKITEADTVDIIAKGIVSQKALTAETTHTLNIEKIRRQTLIDVQALRTKELAQEHELVRARAELDNLPVSRGVEERELELELAEKTGSVDESTLAIAKSRVSLAREELASKSKILALTQTYQTERLKLQQDLNLTEDAQQRKYFEERINLIDRTYEIEKSTEESLHRTRMSNISNIANYEATADIRKGISEAIKTGLNEGSKSGGKKLRENLVGILQKKFDVYIDANVNMLVDTIIGALGSLLTSSGGDGKGGTGSVAGINELSKLVPKGNAVSNTIAGYDAPTGEVANQAYRSGVLMGSKTATGAIAAYDAAASTATDSMWAAQEAFQQTGKTATLAAADSFASSAAEYTATSTALQEGASSFASDLVNVYENVVPYLGAIVKLAQGDVKGAAFTAAGAYIGSIVPGIGTAIGAVIGSIIGSFVGGDGERFKTTYGSASTSYSAKEGTYSKTQYPLSDAKRTFGESMDKTLEGIAKAYTFQLSTLLELFDQQTDITVDATTRLRRTSGKIVGDFFVTLGDKKLKPNWEWEGTKAEDGNQYGGDAEVENALLTFIDDILSKGIVSAVKQSDLPDLIKNVFSSSMTAEEVTNTIDGLVTLQQTLKDSGSSILKFFEGVDVSRYAAGNEKAVDTMNRVVGSLAAANSILETLGFTAFEFSMAGAVASNKLTAAFGGVSEFASASGYFFDNFYSEAEKFKARTDQFAKALDVLGVRGILASSDISRLTDGFGDMRAEYRELVLAQDLNTEAGISAYRALINLSPALVAITDAANSVVARVPSIISSVGLSVDALGDLLQQGIVGSLNVVELGAAVATQIEQGMLKAVADKQIALVTQSIVDQLITPVITAIAAGTSITASVSEEALEKVTNTATQSAKALAIMFGSTEFVSTIKTISEQISSALVSTASVAQISSGSIREVLKTNQEKLKVANTSLSQVYKTQISELTTLRDKFKNFAASIREFSQSLSVGNLSPLSPQEKYAQSKSDLETTFSKAMSGDQDAMSNLQSVSQTFLTLSREYYASSAAYTQDFDRVKTILASAATASDAMASSMDEQITIARNSMLSLGGIEDNVADIARALAEAEANRKAVELENTKIVATTLTNGFTTLDTNIDGVLTSNELRSALNVSESELTNIYKVLDSNGDGQISVLEVISKSTEGTKFAVESLAPLLQGLSTGMYVLEDAIAQYNRLNMANATVGAAPIDVSGKTLSNASQEYRVAEAYNSLLNRAPTLTETKNLASRSENMSYNDMLGDIGSRAIGAGGADATRVYDRVDSYIKTAVESVIGRSASSDEFSALQSGVRSGAFQLSSLYTDLANYAVQNLSGTDATSALRWLEANPNYVPKFAGGGNTNGGLVTVGEQGKELMATGAARFWSAQQTERMISNANNSSNNNAELVQEVKKLNEKIAKLEQTIARGDAINAQATEASGNKVSNAVKDTVATAAHATKVKGKATLV